MKRCRHDPPKDGCRLCWLWQTDARYRARWGGNPADVARTARPMPPARVFPCRHEGPVVEHCRRGCELAHVRDCEVHDRCTRGANNGQVMSCGRCPDFSSPAPVPAGAAAPILAFDEHNLWPGVPGKRFNPSIIDDGDGYLFCVRNGWKGSDLYIGRMDRDFRPVGAPARLALPHSEANYGREDPRLFRYGGRVHVSFIGVVGGNRIRHTSQLFARLSPDGMSVEDVFHPQVPGRNLWEKNHQYFQYGDELYAVYSIAPHRILRIRGNNAEWAYETPTAMHWTGGAMRGGAAPVLVGDEWWCFGHDKIKGPDGRLLYRIFLYTFDNRPPFRVRRFIPEPILSADPATRPADQYCSCVFPGGAVLIGGPPTHNQ